MTSPKRKPPKHASVSIESLLSKLPQRKGITPIKMDVAYAGRVCKLLEIRLVVSEHIRWIAVPTGLRYSVPGSAASNASPVTVWEIMDSQDGERVGVAVAYNYSLGEPHGDSPET